MVVTIYNSNFAKKSEETEAENSAQIGGGSEQFTVNSE